MIEALALAVCPASQKCLLFPSLRVAQDCLQFVTSQNPLCGARSHVISILPNDRGTEVDARLGYSVPTWAVCYDPAYQGIARAFWQHTGEGISSRRAETCLQMLEAGYYTAIPSPLSRGSAGSDGDGKVKAPRRYHKAGLDEREGGSSKAESLTTPQSIPDVSTFVEERFGRNLSAAAASSAKVALRRRITEAMVSRIADNDGGVTPLPAEQLRGQACLPEDVLLFPTGMSSIYNTHRMLLGVFSSRRSICFGLVSTSLLLDQALSIL